jgi:hypothetical protein
MRLPYNFIQAIDMGAQMTSGKMRSMARKINLKSASNIEGIRFI